MFHPLEELAQQILDERRSDDYWKSAQKWEIPEIILNLSWNLKNGFTVVVVRFQPIFLIKTKYSACPDFSPNRPFQELNNINLNTSRLTIT